MWVGRVSFVPMLQRLHAHTRPCLSVKVGPPEPAAKHLYRWRGVLYELVAPSQ